MFTYFTVSKPYYFTHVPVEEPSTVSGTTHSGPHKTGKACGVRYAALVTPPAELSTMTGVSNHMISGALP
jgi:hypothetical protein